MSPSVWASTLTFLPMEVGSTSIWIFLEWGENSLSFPVTRSSNRLPMAIKRSQWVKAMLAR